PLTFESNRSRHLPSRPWSGAVEGLPAALPFRSEKGPEKWDFLWERFTRFFPRFSSLEDVMRQNAALELPELYGKSVLVRFLYEGVGRILTVPGACLLWALVQAGLFAALCWHQGTLFPDRMSGGEGLLQDTTALSYYFLLPLCFLL